jgi:stringent starvation protein B
MTMSSQKPYLIRAIYEWLLDNESTPYLLVNARVDNVQVPQDYVKDGRIVLNIAPDAIHQLSLENEWISFSARFAGRSQDIMVPINAVQAIYSKENNQGMFFPDEEPQPPTKPTDDTADSPNTKGRPALKVVK